MSKEIKKISELPHGERPDDGDFVLVNKGDKSYKMSYKNLKTVLMHTLSANLDIGSMSKMNKEQFSKYAHGHDYSYIDFFPSYCGDEYLKLGTLSITRYGPWDSSTTRAIDIRAPIQVPEIEFRPVGRKIGELQFLPVSNFNSYLTKHRGYKLINIGGQVNVDINDESFDGWVIPNGCTYRCSRSTFKDACRVYSITKTETAESFSVPCVDRFLLMNCNTDSTLDGEENRSGDYKNILVNHSHERLQGRLRFSTYDNEKMYSTIAARFSGYDGMYFCGAPAERSSAIGVPGQIMSLNGGSCSFQNVEVHQSDGALDRETHPSHILIPTLIYIGDM